MKNKKQIKDIFNQFFLGNKNFMTPRVKSYGETSSRFFVFEVSEGDGLFSDGLIYGITVLELNSSQEVIKHRHDLSKCFDNLKSLNKYKNNLINKF